MAEASPRALAAPSASASSARPPLVDELAALERARAMLTADPRGALRAIAAYHAAFPKGRLGVEADALQVEALAGAGDRAASVALARAFVAAHPQHPLAPRVRSLAGLGDDDGGQADPRLFEICAVARDILVYRPTRHDLRGRG